MLKIKALCSDNIVDVDSLIGLFEDVYGENFPAQRVYNRQFWTNHIGSRFISIGAYVGSQIVGHLALQSDRDNPGVVQVSMPAFRPEFFENHRFFSNEFRTLLDKLQQKQNWKCLYTFCFTDNQQLEFLARDILRTSETAILPDYLPGLSTKDLLSIDITNKTDVITSFRVFTNTGSDDERVLFAPEEFQAICKNLYTNLGLKRIFAASSKKLSKKILGLPSDQRSLTVQHYKGINVRHFFCNPSLLGDLRKIDEICKEEVRKSDYFFINLSDPRCPEICEILSRNGFAFSGCLPMLKGNDHIIYYRSPSMEIKLQSFNSDISRKLAASIHLQLNSAESTDSIRELIA